MGKNTIFEIDIKDILRKPKTNKIKESEVDKYIEDHPWKCFDTSFDLRNFLLEFIREYNDNDFEILDIEIYNKQLCKAMVIPQIEIDFAHEVIDKINIDVDFDELSPNDKSIVNEKIFDLSDNHDFRFVSSYEEAKRLVGIISSQDSIDFYLSQIHNFVDNLHDENMQALYLKKNQHYIHEPSRSIRYKNIKKLCEYNIMTKVDDSNINSLCFELSAPILKKAIKELDPSYKGKTKKEHILYVQEKSLDLSKSIKSNIATREYFFPVIYKGSYTAAINFMELQSDIRHGMRSYLHRFEEYLFDISHEYD